ncbi:MAG TPA: hypothetical protein VJ044_13585 [Candidatus Hodarchaeales archaeon]|nr:hypothetical protein [Candidatus Hodarchaeales archaeon]
MTDDRDHFEQLARQEAEEKMWEEHKQHLKTLGELLKEQNVISERFDHIFKEFK